MNFVKYSFGKFNNGGKLKSNIVHSAKKITSFVTALAITINALPVAAMAENADYEYEAPACVEAEEPAEDMLNVYEGNKGAVFGDYVYLIVDGGAQITEYTGSAAELVIPSEINGYSVISIGEKSFYQCESLTNLTIPDSVTSIGEKAFYKCRNLTNIKLGNGVTSICDYAFQYCSSLEGITLPDSVTSIGREAFNNCQGLTSVTIPNSITSMGSGIFSSCANLTSVTIADGITSIGWSAFSRCEKLTSVTIPDSVTSISPEAFSWCESLTSIIIPDSVTSLGYKAFYACHSLASVKIGNSVTIISQGCFYGCRSLKSITIPDGVTSIYSTAFSGCTSLASIVIPDSVTSIGVNAFYNCAALNDVYYTGSEEDWADISIESGNDYLIYAPIHYNYVDPTIKINNFVERLYATMLGRASDANGKAKWVEKLLNGATAADVAVNFVLSPELKQQKLSNEKFVSRMYQTMLNRTPSDSEIANWASYLEAGCTYAFVFRGFLSAPEFSKLCASYGIETGTYAATENRDVNGKLTKFISRLYTKALNRAYDVSGLNFHTGNYISGKYTLDKIASGFILSPEFEKRNLSDADFVECMYNTFFDRASDTSGKAKWLQKMANGMTREDVFNGFVISPEYKALVKSFGL